MDVICFENVSKVYQLGRHRHVKDALLTSRRLRPKRIEVTALREFSLSVTQGESVALLGHNGSGKSTALKILARTIRPTSGSIKSHGRIAPLLELGSGFHPDLTGRENIFLNAAVLGVSRRYIRSHLSDIIDFSELGTHIDLPLRSYSSGMYTRLGFSVAAHVDPSIVLIDEVLAVGDAGFQAKCMAKMQEFKRDGRTVILVTHSWQQAADFCERVAVLTLGRKVFDGSIESGHAAFLASAHQSGGGL